MSWRVFSKLSIVFAGLFMLVTFVPLALAKSPLALTGYDPVSYFQGNKPTKGISEFSSQYNGLTYRFSNANNRDAFAANPARFAPQYDGYCAYGVSRGYKVGVDPLAYKVVKGKLYVNYSRSVQRTWSRDIPGYIAKAEKNWPTLD